MSSRGHTVIAALAVVVAMLVAAVPAGAALNNGLTGYVTDPATGLGVNGATVTWKGTTTPLPVATTGPTGKYVLLGLDANTGGTLSIVGPAGWDRVDLGGITVPDKDLGTHDVQLQRDWATPAGGATASSNDESGAEGGAPCGSGAAVDTDRTTGWSASATRTASDPATLTVQLPQPVDVRQLVIAAGAACGHPAGAALGRYRLETSPDGTAWTTAAEGEFGADAREKDTALTPSAGTSGVRFVRLVALSAQEAGSATIDVRELVVRGLGPNAAPSGTLTSDVTRTPVNAAIRLRAAFTDSDSTIVRYLWDFDSDGTWDQATLGPSVAHAWAGQGNWRVTVGARDFRGGLGTATYDLYVFDPKIPIEAVPQRKPLITFSPVAGIDLDTRTACASRCSLQAKFVVSARDARKLRLKHRTLKTWRKTIKAAGIGSFTFSLPQKTIKVLRKHKYKKLRVRVTVQVVDAQGRRSVKRQWVTFR